MMRTIWRSALLLAICALLAACGGQPTVPSAANPTAAAPTASLPSPEPAPTTALAAATPSAGAQPSATPDERTLQQQDPPLTGEDVRAVQQRLLDLGYRQVGAADGVFGPQTATAVSAFQQLNALDVDGIVGPQTRARLQDAAATPAWAVVPLATELCGEHLLLGASYGATWFDNKAAGQMLRSGEAYRLYNATQQTGSATGPAPQQRTPSEPPLFETFFVTLDPPPAASAFAIGGQWNPLPRPATVISGTPALDAYGAAVADFLRGQGIAQPALGHSPEGAPDRFVAWRADTDGDGSEEVIISAEHLVPNEEAPGEYTLVLVLRGGAPTLVAGDVYPNGINDFEEANHRIAALLDANGDGTLEALVSTSHFESAEVSLYRLGGEPAGLVSVWCGV